MCSQCVWDNHESAPAAIGNRYPDHDSRRRSSVFRPQAVWLQEFPWPPSDQHMAITGTKVEPAFNRKHKRSVCPLMSSGWCHKWRQWNTRVRAPGLELSLK
ncbi:uncharacterized protein TNCV_1357381 [Trichonephila clavipes]|uniref:Uncharacterized protein n=1 Tax=Trichonephila clavipes TaxID=2585209 RepID=A0A8X6V813_TRICX|nr:uncharacterized protein TNCV_1357381 [Trichonephila clavipes]